MQRRFLDVIAIIGIETAACDRPKLTSREGETSKIQVQPPRDVLKIRPRICHRMRTMENP